MRSCSIFSLILISIISILLSPSTCLLSQLRVTLNDTTINSISTHTWTLTYTNNISRAQFVLNFPPCVYVQSNTFVTFLGTSGHTINNLVASSNSLNFTLSVPTSSLIYVIAVNNVKNCFRASSSRSFTVYSKADGLTQSFSSMTSVLYTQGTISNCLLTYNGSTGDVPSTLQIGFKIKNPVVAGSPFIVRVQYPVYFSSSLELTTYNSPSMTPNYAATCKMYANGVMQGVQTNAVITFTNKTIICSFTGVTVTDADNLTLHLVNINNPVTSTAYASNTDFILTTIDSSGNNYDRSSFCTLTPVNVAEFTATFLQTDIVNAGLYPLSISSNQPISIRIARNDKILLRYTAGEFSTCTGQLLVDKNSGPLFTFGQQSTNINQAKLYQSNGGSDVNGTLNIQFEGCTFEMPPSTIPIQFTLHFSGTGTTVGVYDDYMLITGTLTPNAATLTISRVTLLPSVTTIGDLSTYTFTITVNQPLSQNPCILIDFPTQITITTANSTLSSCTVAINTLGIGSKLCQLQGTSSILISLTHTISISNGTSIQIAIPNVQNPSNPTPSVSGFNIKTYYTCSQMSGLVQVGTNVITSQQFTARKIYPQIPNNNFTVYTPDTVLTIVYQVGVNYPPNSITTLTFNTTSLQTISYVSSSYSFNSATSPILKLSNTTTQFIFNTPSIPSGSIVTFVFKGLTPSKTGIYPVVDIVTTSSGNQYQKTDSTVTFEVALPKTETFTATPNSLQSITGRITDYTFSFTTTVPHPSTFILQISFPTGTNFQNGQATCGLDCLGPISDTSSGSLDRIQLTMTPTATVCTSCLYRAKVTQIRNQRMTGSTGLFLFRTMTTRRQLILKGSASTIILTPNVLNATMLDSDDYYRSNTNPIHFEASLTNKLEEGDFFIITFHTDSYTLNSAVGCAEGTCTSLTSTPTLLVKAIPTATQVIETIINWEINGLISSPVTVYGQTATITVETWFPINSSASEKIDSGTMTYRLDCASTTLQPYLCKTCAIIGTEVCTSCYSPDYFLFNSTKCTNQCGNLSQYQTYPNSGICVPCVTPCYTCLDNVNCTKCITGFYLMPTLQRCLSSCNTSNGYYILVELGFSYCIECTQPNCKSCTNSICTACKSNWVLLNGACTGGCADGTYNSGGLCTKCDKSCLTCDGPSNTDCFDCATNYYSIDGQCTSKCPTGMVVLATGVCGCDGGCKTCVNISTKCLSCSDPTMFYYNYKCQNVCPISTYAVGKQCLKCTSGCQRCSSTTCIQCLDNYNIFENRCYQYCKSIGPRYTSMLINGVYRCDQCPDGCSQCNLLYECTQCFTDYYLVDKVCKRVCQATNTCNVLVTPDPVIALPGVITFVLWAGIIVGLKLFFIKGIYVPYALLFAGALIQFVILATTLGTVDVKLKSITGRLLQAEPTTTTLGILTVSMVLNYLMNIVAIWIFCKFVKPLIQPRQVDRISNYVVLAIGVLTNYRFYLLAFSRLFKKPHVEVNAPEKLKNFHLILGVSYLLDILTLVAGFILVINATKLSILFMLGIDLIILIFVLWGIFIYVLVMPKPDEYYSETKKYSLQENHITEEGSMHNNNQKDFSKAKINLTNEKLQVEDYNGEENIDNIPTTQPNVIKIGQNNLEKIQQIEQSSNPKTKRRSKKAEVTYASSNKLKQSQAMEKPSLVQPVSQRNKNKQVANESLDMEIENDKEVQEKNNLSKRKTHERTRSEKAILNDRKKLKDEVYQFEQDQREQKQEREKEQQKGEVPMKSTKYKAGRSSTLKIEQSSMKKKLNYGTFESEVADSQVDEVDLESIIQTKLVDRSKQKRQQRDTRTEADHTQDRHQQYEEISPSWFNIQNQRYDVEDRQQE